MVYPKDWEKVTCYDWCEDEKKIWLCLRNKNAICEIDKKSNNTKILGSFPHNRLGDDDLSLSIEKNGDYIVFCPFKANDIAVLKISTGELDFIDLSNYLNKSNYMSTRIEKFYRTASYKNYIYFFGIRYPVIMRLDPETKVVDFFDDWLEEIEKHKCQDATSFTDGYAKKESEIYLPIGKCNGVLKVEMDTMDWKYLELKSVDHGILGMTQKKNLVWLTEYDARAKSFFEWNLDNGLITQINLPSQDAFYAPLYYNKSLLFFKNYGKKSYRYELESGKWEEITNIMPGLEKSSDKKVRKDEIDYFSGKSKKFYHWNFKTNTAYHNEFQIEEKEFLMNSWMDYYERLQQDVVNEGRMTIRDYIEVIC